MSVRAKFKCVGFDATQQNFMNPETGKYDNVVELRTVRLQPVYGNGDPNHENTKFWNASPSGSIQLGTVNPAAWGAFELGAEYYVDFTPAPKD